MLSKHFSHGTAPAVLQESDLVSEDSLDSETDISIVYGEFN